MAADVRPIRTKRDHEAAHDQRDQVRDDGPEPVEDVVTDVL
jgi:hypothetical protein